MKNNKIAILLLVIIAITFNSCNQFGIGHNIEANENYNESVTPSIEQIEKPTVEKIQNDLIGVSVNNWKFDKLEEFKNTEIISSTIKDDDSTLEIMADLDLVSYSTSEPYRGQITIIYHLYETTWMFKNVSGYINKTENETIGNDDNTIGTDKGINNDVTIGNDNTIGRDDNSNLNETGKTTAKCEWCSRKFDIKMETITELGFKVSVYRGGCFCSGQNGDCGKKSSGDLSALGMLNGNPPIPKYCSKRCAYDAGD